MTPETPLTEVAKLLPTEAAKLLDGQSSEVQSLALGLLRGQIVYWEDQGISLDPVQFNVVVNGLVITTLSVYVAALLGGRLGSP